MTPTYPHLFAPIRIGNLELANRVVSSSHGERMSEDNCISEREIAYYEEKARGGTGLIVLDGVRTSIETAPNRHALVGTAPGQREGYRRLAGAVHAHGTAIFGQILHQGSQTATTFSRRALVSASAIPNPVFREIPHRLDGREIRRVITDMVDTASIMREGGLDGIELHAAHGYLIAQFLSLKTNDRQDDYGGSLENRMRFGLEAIAAIRAAIGGDYPFGIRLNAEDLTSGGCSREDMMTIARHFVAAGRLDYLSVSIGTYYDSGLSEMVGDFSHEPGYLASNARPFKQAFPDIAVMTVGRITQPDVAEAIIARGDADMCAMARTIIADPDWANKARAGEAHRIRPCIACNTCLVMNRAVTPITCAVNPTCGEEREFGNALRTHASNRRKVLVVGGGVAGLEAARSAAERGHVVTLMEAGERLGGQVEMLARTKNRAEMALLVDYYRTELERLGVEIHLGRRFDAHALEEFGDCHIIFATGARGRASRDFDAPDVPVVDSFDVLRDPARLKGMARVLLVDRDHYYGASSVAHHLRDLGVAVAMITENPMIGIDLPPGALAGVLGKLVGAGVEILPLSRLTEVRNGVAKIRNLLNGGISEIGDVGAIVVVGERVAVDEDYAVLAELRDDVRLIGDAMAPRQIWQAIREGFFAGQGV